MVRRNNAAFSSDVGTPPVSIQVWIGIVTGDGELVPTDSFPKIDTVHRSPMYPKPLASLHDLYGEKVLGAYSDHLNIRTDVLPFQVAAGASVKAGGTLVATVNSENHFFAEFHAVEVMGTPNSGPHNLTFDSVYSPRGGDFAAEQGGGPLIRKMSLSPGSDDVSFVIRDCPGQFYRQGDSCEMCPQDSFRVTSDGPVDNACRCNDNFYPLLSIKKDVCTCMEKWVYTGFDDKTYYGCTETYDWPGNTWCWVEGGNKCAGAVKGSLPIEERFWRVCDDAKDKTL